MKDDKRNIMVAIFVLVGLSGLGWMIFQFGDLPTWIRRYDAQKIIVYFPEAPGIQENSSVLFRGYPVGRVIEIKPPMLLSDLEKPELKYYQVAVVVAISTDYQIPRNTRPKIYHRGLGGSFMEFVLEEEMVSGELLADGDQLKGVVSEASEFINEKTQNKLDQLIASLMLLSDNLQGQLTSLAPEVVDRADPNLIQPNVTTAVIRMDRALKNLNTIVGDKQTQQNFKKILADFVSLSDDIRKAVRSTQKFTEDASKLLDRTAQTITNVEGMADGLYETFQATGAKMQDTADVLSQCLNRLDHILARVASGEGSAGKVLNDARLYEALTDASENLTLALTEFRELIAKWSEKGMKVKME